MRPLVLLAALALAGCDLLGPGRVRHAAVVEVAVERLPLDARWDGGFWAPDDAPDVYLDLKAKDDGRSAFGPRYVWRSDVHENLGALPLRVRPAGEARVALADTVWLNVVDRDNVGDDLMFTTGDFTFADHADGVEPGDTGTLAFGDSLSAVRLTVRWE